MNVRDLMTSSVRACTPEQSLAAAARMLWDQDCGILPVVDASARVQATITDRDVCMAAFLRGKPLGELRVADCMSRSLVTCRPEDDLASAARRMVEHRVRRLPVVASEGRLCGMLALADLARAAPTSHEVAREALRVLAAVSQPREAPDERGKVNPRRARTLLASATDGEC